MKLFICNDEITKEGHEQWGGYNVPKDAYKTGVDSYVQDVGNRNNVYGLALEAGLSEEEAQRVSNGEEVETDNGSWLTLYSPW